MLNGLDGGYGTSPALANQQSNQPDWSIIEQLYDRPHAFHHLLAGRCPKELEDIAKNSTEDFKLHVFASSF